MKQMNVLLAAGAAALVCGSAISAEPLVVGTGFDQPAEWQGRPFCGKDFFLVLSAHDWAAPGAKNVPDGFTVYRECGWRVEGRCPEGVKDYFNPSGKSSYESIMGLKPGEKAGYAARVPESKRRTTPYTLHDMLELRHGKAGADRLYSQADADRPMILMLDERPAFRLQDKFPLADRADYAKWRASHPNCLGFYALLEFDSDLSYYFINFGDTKDPQAFVDLQKAYPCTFWDYACDTALPDRWIDEAYRRSCEYCFGAKDAWAFSAHTPGMIPLFAKAGCAGVTYEATTQGMEGNWRFATPYLRGAARQFGMDYGWYTASFYDGFKRGDKPGTRMQSGENSLVGKIPAYGFFGLNRGASFPLIDRQNAYGWLNGSRYVEVENWGTYHRKKVERKVKGKGEGEERTLVEYVPSEAARDFEALHRLAKRESRGIAYAPLALVFPIHEKLTRGGGTEFFTSFRQGVAMFTLVPGDTGPDPLRLRGVEGGFYNSEFADFFDVVTADGQPGAGKTFAALRPYKAAVVIGRHEKANFPTDDVRRYASEGGTLFISCDCVRDGLVDEATAGVAFPGRAIALSDGMLVDENGGRTALTEPYALRVGKAGSARVLWRDGKGTPVAFANEVGKGRVVTIAADGMLPYGWDTTWGIRNCVRYNREMGMIRRGEVKFDILHEVFRRIQAETMPFRVAGDIHWGVNKIEVKGKGEGEEKKVKGKGEGEEKKVKGKGEGEEKKVKGKGEGEDKSNNQTIKQSNNSSRWLVYLFNNKGITNYLDEAPVIDRAYDAKVTVSGALGVKIAAVRDIRIDADARDNSNNSNPQTLKPSNNSFTVTVPAGGWAAYEVCE